MITDDEITKISYIIASRFEKVNIYYLTLLAEQVKEIGNLSPENMHTLEQMAKMGANIDSINSFLAVQTGLALSDIDNLYERVAYDIYKDVADLYKAGNVAQPKFKDNARLQTYLNSTKQLTKNTFINMSNTTAISKTYKATVDFAVDAVAQGLDNYDNVIKRFIIDKSTNGAKIEYASGVTRRIDSAARMNILEGVRKLSDGIREECGRQYGADGVEIDAHGLCAKDHQHIQGKQYTFDEFNKLNNSLQRKIGTCNCKHKIQYIIMGVSKPAYTPDELKELGEYANKEITVKDKTMTRYEASQKMRAMETQMRYKQDEIVALRKSGSDDKKQVDQLRQLKKQYYYISKRAGLKTRYDRAYVPGFDINKFA